MSKQPSVRQQFLEYFIRQGHTHVANAPIIPADDPTLLFTNAGMNQFKEVLLGQEQRSYTRAVSAQPCMRVGGKHNDLDEVGRDGRHLTWFEMLGNWSFGDYGKEEAIAFAWDFVTKHLDMDTSRIYASVYKTDDESYALWKKIAGLPESRIVRLGDIEQGDEENFWSMGPTGPCGRCTELYYDQGEAAFGHDVVGGESDRFLEFWNLVFMEFNRDESGVTTPLKMFSVDTGMGLERITALLEGHSNVFDTSLFQPVIQAAAEMAGVKQVGAHLVPLRVLADHSRALTFTLAEGGVFDKQGRGYVLRRILRRAVLHGTKLGFKMPFLHKLVQHNLAALPFYQDAAKQQALITESIKVEEERFFETLDRGLAFFAKAASDNAISGQAAFQLHDTYGFPIDLTRIMAEERGLAVDMAGFDSALEEQRARSSAASHFYDKGGWQILRTEEPAAQPATHGLSSLSVHVLQYRQQEDGTVQCILNQTPFYAEGGGEVADQGMLAGEGVRMRITHTGKSSVGIVHTGVFEQGGSAQLNQPLLAQVDTTYRAGKAAHHTATHLLHAALRQVLGDDVRQMGSLVDAGRLRFDIAFNRALSDAEVEQVETLVNQWIVTDHPVQHLPDMPYPQAVAMGALAFFGDKYGETVRVIHIPDVSTELCGGNHVQRTGQIGAVYITNQEALGAGVRRIEAVAHLAAVATVRAQQQLLSRLAMQLAAPVNQLDAKIDKLQDDLKKARQAYQKAMKNGGGAPDAAALLAQAHTHNGGVWVTADLGTLPLDAAKTLADGLRAREPRAVSILWRLEEDSDKGMILVSAGDAAVAEGRHAGSIAKAIGQQLGAGGGGKPAFAQTGFKGATSEQIQAVVMAIIRAA